MPKQKTRKSAQKRFKVTSTGKILRRRSFSGHLRVKKSSKAKRQQRRQVEVGATYAKKLRKALGLRKKTTKIKKQPINS